MRSLRTSGAVYAATGLPFGLLAGVAVGIALGSVGAGVVAGLAAGLVFGGVMALVLGTVDAVSDPAGPDARPGPRQDATVPVRTGDDLHGRIVAALQALPAEVREADARAGRYRARTRWSWKSWGEEVSVQLSGAGAALEAVVSSRPVVPTTVVDYGKGRSNVAAVAEALRS